MILLNPIVIAKNFSLDMYSSQISRGTDFQGKEEFLWTAASWYMNPDICATLLQIICFYSTEVISSPYWEFHMKKNKILSRWSGTSEEFIFFSCHEVIMIQKGCFTEHCTDHRSHSSLMTPLKTEIPCNNISASSP